TPAFCTSRACGPEVKAVQSLEPTYRNRLAFIHVEIYTDFKPDPSKKQLAPAVIDWRLQTEPWIFLIDSKGIIQSRFEGPTATDEIQAAIDQLLR
ncbi:MAG TPA: thioredoxin family protein, partial [Candidatus Angelobacter sp.]|nr:thioredoxin family protein [Candidatus Angelobacter sp.]